MESESMRAFGTGTKALLLSSTLLFSSLLIVDRGQAAQSGDEALRPTASYRPHAINSHSWDAKLSPTVTLDATRSYMSCVPYARQVSGIKVAGNAWQWWNNSEGLYARGDQPET